MIDKMGKMTVFYRVVRVPGRWHLNRNLKKVREWFILYLGNNVLSRENSKYENLETRAFTWLFFFFKKHQGNRISSILWARGQVVAAKSSEEPDHTTFESRALTEVRLRWVGQYFSKMLATNWCKWNTVCTWKREIITCGKSEKSLWKKDKAGLHKGKIMSFGGRKTWVWVLPWPLDWQNLGQEN